MLDSLNNLDRRWIFLAMAICVGAPILLGIGSDETPTPPTQRLFDQIEDLPTGSPVLLAVDYDPNSAAELTPMALAFARHCCLKRHRVLLVSSWGTALPMIDSLIKTVFQKEFSSGENPYVYGEDYINLGYFPGEAVAISQIASSIRKAKSHDARGTSLDAIPMMKDLTSAKDMKLILNASGGYPGAKEWVQYASTPYGIPLAAGCTGVQSTQMFPYYPDQLVGLVAGIRGAIEYETMMASKYPKFMVVSRQPARIRGGAQRWGHRLMIALIVLGNGIHFANRYRRTVV